MYYITDVYYVKWAYFSTGSALGSASMLSQSLSNKSSPNMDAKNPGIAFISRNTFQIFHNLHHFRIIRHPRVGMSTPGTQKRRKQEGEKTRKRMPAESPRNKTSGKVRGGQAWVPLPSNPKLMVPVGKTEKYPKEIRDILSALQTLGAWTDIQERPRDISVEPPQ